MEFNFNINTFFKEEITKVGSRLIPDGFIGDRREVQDCLSKVSYILTILGEKSAKAQGLQKVITSGEKLRNSDHVVYVLIDPKGGSKGLGTVLGMLKMGMKHLYVFDAGGISHEVTTKCVLDFYIHESKQRMGLGKKLFQHMLKEERVDPVHLAIDKPSTKFLSFLLKHYGLQKIIPQMNNFVVFDGFFSNRSFGEDGEKTKIPGGSSSGEARFSSGGPGRDSSLSPTSHHYQQASAMSVNSPMPFFGRPAPHKPVSTMGMILQHRPSSRQQPQESGREKEEIPPTDSSPHEDINETKEPKQEQESEIVTEENLVPENVSAPEIVEETKQEVEKPKEEECIPVSPVTPVTPTESPMAPEISKEKIRVNSQGHLDLKFYHSSLW